jgi:hypothetical protein
MTWFAGTDTERWYSPRPRLRRFSMPIPAAIPRKERSYFQCNITGMCGYLLAYSRDRTTPRRGNTECRRCLRMSMSRASPGYPEEIVWDRPLWPKIQQGEKLERRESMTAKKHHVSCMHQRERASKTAREVTLSATSSRVCLRTAGERLR